MPGLSPGFELVSEPADGTVVARREGTVDDREGFAECGKSDLAAVLGDDADIGGGIGAPKVGPVRRGSNAEAGRRGGPV